MEGILHRALVVSLYCNLFPLPDVPLSKHGNVHPRNPCANISSGCYMFTWGMAKRRDREGDRSSGGWRTDKEGKEEKKRQTDEDVRHMLTPADDTRMTWRSEGRSRPERGCNSHKCCNGWYFEFSSFEVWTDLLYLSVVTQKCSYKCYFDLEPNISVRWHLVVPLWNQALWRDEPTCFMMDWLDFSLFIFFYIQYT